MSLSVLSVSLELEGAELEVKLPWPCYCGQAGRR